MTPLTPRRLALGLAAGLAFALTAAVVALLVGMPEVDLGVALDDPTSWQHVALYRLQLPRILQGLLVGATLAASGAALQGLLRNPLADPFILGVSGGAALSSVGSTDIALVAPATMNPPSLVAHRSIPPE